MASTLSPLIWLTQRYVRQLGLPGLIGLAGIILGSAYFVLWQPTQQAALQQLERDLKLGQQQPKKLQATNPAIQGRVLAAALPPIDTLPDWLDAMADVAATTKVTLGKTQYQLSPVNGLPVQRYQLTLTVKGSYLNVRQFMQQLISGIPHVAIDGVALERASITQPTVDATLRLSFFLQGAA
ncbi:GspMb/PilO family protein [Chitinivorax sp. B]|uniref:GspMb/PilO family protein n=1 Tax=Chitinivorax sp. B TaxID=2502235 RepID=UPI0010F4A4D1|nr:GspMb/PilO family protein [Chitinivorax sp. B]